MEKISILGFLLVILCLITRDLACKGETLEGNCLRADREALLDFKNGLKDSSHNRLSSWIGGNCCQWEGIGCENNTGVVISIDLHNPYYLEEAYENWSSMNLSGEIRPSLIELKYLRSLDLSGNSFEHIPIPKFFGSLKSLQYLNLSNCGFRGAIPPTLGNLSNLQFLDLSSIESQLFVKNLEWMTNLVSLRHLKLNYVNLSMVESHWMEVFSKLSFLTELHLQHCGLSGSISSLNSINFTSLSVISISGNSFRSKFPIWLLNISSLIYIDVSSNQLYGQISPGLGELPNLQHLNLSWNENLTGSCSQLLSGSWKKIEFLNLAINKFLGTIPTSIGNFCNLKHLDLGINTLTGSFSEFLEEIKNCSSEGPLPKLRYLDLSWNQLVGRLPERLSQLEKLTYLDLSGNKLQGPIPASFGTFKNLNEIWLKMNELNGSLPVSFGQLSELVVLDVSYNRLTGILSEEHFSKLNKLKTLQMDENSGLVLNVSSTWVPPFQITDLGMSSCNLGPSFPTWLRSQKEVSYLYLSSANISGSIPKWFWNISFNLQDLCLYDNPLQGILSEEHFSKLSKLKMLLMGENSGLILNVSSTWVLPFQISDLSMDSWNLGPSFPTWLRSQKELSFLDLSNASISGSIPKWFWNISFNLEDLILSDNQLQGILSEEHFSKLSKLKMLFMDGNSGLILNVSSTWVPPFQIIDLSMASCNLGPSFPTWLRSQKELSYLDLSNNSISGSIPKWFWNISFKLEDLILSDNQLQGQLPNSLKFTSRDHVYIDFSYNLFEGPIPFSIKGLYSLDLSHNKFSGFFPLSRGESMLSLHSLLLSDNQITGFIPLNIGKSMPNLSYLSLSSNQITGVIPSNIDESLPNLVFLSLSSNRITGTIPDSIGRITNLEVIDFSRNNLTGSIPSTINNCSNLFVLDLGNNNLSGIIPKSLGQLQSLQSLHLNHNELSGELPSSWQNLTHLDVLDLSYNRLLGQVPTWIGTAFVNLVILNLRSNLFFGRLPSRLSNLSSLHVLDIAQNNLMGEIPITLVELKAMAQEKLNIHQLNVNVSSRYEERLVVIAKGQSLEYTRTLSLVVGIDLSDNNLSGEFPQEITKLFGLVFLNLSRNHITGQIPESISMLRQMSSLDLSSNKLSSTIPSSMASLSFLSYLNLSNNNFSGKIPFTGQMTTFTELAFVGNPDLCGAPLATKCQDEDPNKRQSVVSDKNDGGYVDQWFYLSVGLGFAMGILVPFFVLATRKSWCEAYFDFVDEIVRWLLRGRATYAKNHLRRR